MCVCVCVCAIMIINKFGMLGFDLVIIIIF